MAYVTAAELVAILGPGADPERAELATVAVSDWIDERTGRSWGDADPFAGPVPARVHQLALNGAMRLYHGPEAPYGIVGAASDIPMRVGGIMAALDADALLLGLRDDFGIA